MKRTFVVTVAFALAFVLAGTSGCASRRTGDVTGREAGGSLRHAVIASETGSTARRAIGRAMVGGSGGAAIGTDMDAQADGLARGLLFAQVWRVDEGIAVVIDSSLLFDFESSALAADAHSGLHGLAASLRDERRTRILVLGHTDSFAADAYNQPLSARRGRAVADYLRSQGIASSRLVTHGRGGREPIATNETDRGRLENRRIEVAIYADDDWRRSAKVASTAP